MDVQCRKCYITPYNFSTGFNYSNDNPMSIFVVLELKYSNMPSFRWVCDVLEAVTMKSTFFKNMTPWSLVAFRQRFARTHCLYIWGRKLTN
jgi:hypothetical protein